MPFFRAVNGGDGGAPVGLVEDVGRRIAEVRAERGWTQEECAVRLRLTVRRLRRFEAGANVTLLTLERIAGALGVTARDLLAVPASRKRPQPGRPRKEAAARPSPSSPYEAPAPMSATLQEPPQRRRARPR